MHATVEGRRLGERLTGRQLERVGRVFDLLNREQRRELLSTLESMNASIAGRR